jgi:Leucine-rich repeat (LRR) protein
MSLVSLSLSIGDSREFPPDLGLHTHLTSLTISLCMPQVSPAITTLTNLGILRFRFNGLTELPQGLPLLPRLVTLQCTCNQLEQFPDALWPALETLDVSSNRLSSFSGTFPRLVRLYLRGNKISSLSPSLGDCPALREINASHNCLRSLPAALKNRTALKTLSVAYNPELMTLPFELLTHYDQRTTIEIASTGVADTWGPLIRNVVWLVGENRRAQLENRLFAAEISGTPDEIKSAEEKLWLELQHTLMRLRTQNTYRRKLLEELSEERRGLQKGDPRIDLREEVGQIRTRDGQLWEQLKDTGYQILRTEQRIQSHLQRAQRSAQCDRKLDPIEPARDPLPDEAYRGPILTVRGQVVTP